MKYTIAARGSKLALVQAESVRARLAAAYPEDVFEIEIVKTKGDLILDKPLNEIGDKGVFVKEIEEKILKGEADIGVHSMKDMPARPAAGLQFTKPWKREDPKDVLILREKKSLDELPKGAVIGTGSRRREFQLKRLRPDLKIVNIRGNVDTRLRKMEEQKLDGIVLAAAGLRRLGLQNKITQYLDTEQMIPAPAQGILALEIRENSRHLLEMLNAFCEEETVRAAEAERGFLEKIGGDCHVPVGAVCQKREDGTYRLDAMFGNASGSRQAYTSVCGTNMEELAQSAAVQIRRQMAGTVYLTGAGPGDPELITVKGLEIIQTADCIIYDRLAAPQLLEEAKDGCEMIYAGKENHNHTMKQEEINRLLVKKSMEYETVVRLKGGDSYVFGRGGEEALFLAENGVPFEVIPGITSSTAGPAFAGIPITHRGKALGFHVVTAHNQKDELADIDFEAMARGKETCVFLMGLSRTAEIAEKLMEAGMPEHTGAAVISCAATPRQKTCVSDLAHIAEVVKQAQLVSPAVIVAGDVVSLRDQLNFYERKPLFGKRYLIPKIGTASTRLRKLLQKQGAEAEEVQVGRVVNVKEAFLPEELKDADWLLFTSGNGVNEFFKSLAQSRLDVRILSGCRIAAIGAKTAEALEKHGLYADFIPRDFNSTAFAQELRRHLAGNEKVYYLKAADAGSHLKESLEDYCCFHEIVLYENQPVVPDLKGIGPLQEYDGVVFTCASSAKRLITAFGEDWEPHGSIYSIGPKTTACLKKLGVQKVLEAGRSDYEGLAERIIG